MSQTLLSIGHGYSAQALERHLLADGWTVIGTTRSAEKAREMTARGVEALIWPGTPLPLKRVRHVLSSVAPDDGRDPVLAEAQEAIKRSNLDFLGYFSTTSVYGDHAGGWVDEDTPPRALSPRGRDRLAAEAAWASTGQPLHVFRLGGIYGPGRGPFEKIRQGRAQRVIKANQFFSRIHIDDIARVVAAALRSPRPGIYNLVDDEPAPPQDVLAYAARLIGHPVPPEVPFAAAEMSRMARAFYSDSKRVRNARVKAAFGVALAYPTYREGLAQIAEAEAA